MWWIESKEDRKTLLCVGCVSRLCVLYYPRGFLAPLHVYIFYTTVSLVGMWRMVGFFFFFFSSRGHSGYTKIQHPCDVSLWQSDSDLFSTLFLNNSWTSMCVSFFFFFSLLSSLSHPFYPFSSLCYSTLSLYVSRIFIFAIHLAYTDTYIFYVLTFAIFHLSVK